MALVYDWENLAIALERAHAATSAFYLSLARGSVSPGERARAAACFADTARLLESFWMRERDALDDERCNKADDALEESTDAQTLLHVLRCLCLVNVLACNDRLAHVVRGVEAAGLPSVAGQDLVMARGPVLGYSASELRDALWQLAARWSGIAVDENVELYLETLELRYATMLRCELGADTHDVEEFRTGARATGAAAGGAADERLYVCSAKMRSEMTAWFGAFTDALWTRGAFPRRDAERLGGSPPPLLLRAGRVTRALARFCEVTRSADELQRVYTRECGAASLRPGECDAFAPENPLYQPSPHNVLRTRRGPRPHQAVQRKALRPVLDVVKRAQEKMEAANCLRNAGLTWDEDVSILCATDMFFKNRYQVEWKRLFVVHQSEFRERNRAFARGGPPVLFNDCNGFNVVHDGALLVTDCLPASVALWLRIVGEEFDGVVDDGDVSSLCDYVSLRTDVDPSDAAGLAVVTAGSAVRV
jgi:hypothetical protein